MNPQGLTPRTKKYLLFAGIILASLLFVYLFFHYLFVFISPFFFGWLLSLLFHPFVSFLHKKLKIPRGLGAILSLLLLFAFCSSIVAGIYFRLSREAHQFIDNLPLYMDNIKLGFASLQRLIDGVLPMLPDGVSLKLDISQLDLASLLGSVASGSGQASFRFVMSIPNGLVLTLMALLSSYFFTKDRDEIYTFLRLHLPREWVLGAALLRKDLVGAFAGYIKTQLILMVFTFLICIIGLFLLKSPYALLLSVIISIIDALPFFGSGFLLWPAALFSLLSGTPLLAAGYMSIYLLVTLIRRILEPKILGEQIGLHPLVTLITMYLGLRLIGVFGMILGPLAAVMVQAGLRIYNKEKAASC